MARVYSDSARLYRLADRLEEDGKNLDAAVCRNAGERLEILEEIALDAVVSARKTAHGDT